MTTGLWTAYEAAAATGGALCARGALAQADELPEESWTARGLSIDTRTIKPGEIFVALQDVRDGHDFVRRAFGAGAAAALVSRAPADTPDGAPLLLVDDTLKGLSALAVAARDRCFGKLIAITGSAGKTSTKEQLRAALMPSGKVHAADKSFNNHLGVPLTLAALPANVDFGVFEIGMNHPGEIAPLAQLVRPHIAIITIVAAAHLEFFSSVEKIAEAKAEIFSGVRKGGTIILPKDNHYFDLLANRARQCMGSGGGAEIISFGATKGADLRMLDYHIAHDGIGVMRAEIFGQQKKIRMGMPGQHQAMNALATLAGVSAAGGNLDLAIDALERLQPVGGRGQAVAITLAGKAVTLLDESYNANPVSMAAAISVLGNMCSGGQAEQPKGEATSRTAGWQARRRIAVLGEMRELGEEAGTLHKALGALLVDAHINRVFAAGALMKPMFEALPAPMRGGWAESAVDLVDMVRHEAHEGDVIMAKGSNASRVADFVKSLQG